MNHNHPTGLGIRVQDGINQNAPTMAGLTEDVKYLTRRINSLAEQLLHVLYGEMSPADVMPAKAADQACLFSELLSIQATAVDTERVLQSLIERIRGL